jgi:hypothetical protein
MAATLSRRTFVNTLGLGAVGLSLNSCQGTPSKKATSQTRISSNDTQPIC